MSPHNFHFFPNRTPFCHAKTLAPLLLVQSPHSASPFAIQEAEWGPISLFSAHTIGYEPKPWLGDQQFMSSSGTAQHRPAPVFCTHVHSQFPEFSEEIASRAFDCSSPSDKIHSCPQCVARVTLGLSHFAQTICSPHIF